MAPGFDKHEDVIGGDAQNEEYYKRVQSLVVVYSKYALEQQSCDSKRSGNHKGPDESEEEGLQMNDEVKHDKRHREECKRGVLLHDIIEHL